MTLRTVLRLAATVVVALAGSVVAGPTGPAQAGVPNGVYVLKSPFRPTECLTEVAWEGLALAWMLPCDGGAGQKWSFETTATTPNPDYKMLRSVSVPALCLDAQDRGGLTGVVDLYNCNPYSLNQAWDFPDVGTTGKTCLLKAYLCDLTLTLDNFVFAGGGGGTGGWLCPAEKGPSFCVSPDSGSALTPPDDTGPDTLAPFRTELWNTFSAGMANRWTWSVHRVS